MREEPAEVVALDCPPPPNGKDGPTTIHADPMILMDEETGFDTPQEALVNYIQVIGTIKVSADELAVASESDSQVVYVQLDEAKRPVASVTVSRLANDRWMGEHSSACVHEGVDK